MADPVTIATGIAAVAGAVTATNSAIKSFGSDKPSGPSAPSTRQKPIERKDIDDARRQAEERKRRAAGSQNERSQNILTSPQGITAQSTGASKKQALGK